MKGFPARWGRGEPVAGRYREDKDAPPVPRRLVTRVVNAGLPLALGWVSPLPPRAESGARCTTDYLEHAPRFMTGFLCDVLLKEELRIHYILTVLGKLFLLMYFAS
ncbi:hypothetical protein GRJ2_000709200 [Grus japonensis]|uniref:Uncharacterized protein n=1 Tax=Grus japonensis TaxID=30415 RepID=A0ABC9WCA2_GRUJA